MQTASIAGHGTMPSVPEGSAATTTPQEIINAVQAMLEEAAATLEQQPPTTSTSTSTSEGTSPTPLRRSQGVSAGSSLYNRVLFSFVYPLPLPICMRIKV